MSVYLFVQPFCIFLRISSVVFLKCLLEVDVVERQSSYEFPDMDRRHEHLNIAFFYLLLITKNYAFSWWRIFTYKSYMKEMKIKKMKIILGNQVSIVLNENNLRQSGLHSFTHPLPPFPPRLREG